MSSITGRKTKRNIMIRIGFDPILEAELQHKELIEQAQYERMLREARGTSQNKAAASSRLLALIGKEMASIGLRLAERFSDGSQVTVESVSHNSASCG
jgi:hypothetical protein